jgi:hypothetical protein
MDTKEKNIQEISSHLQLLSVEEQQAVQLLVKTMAEVACKRETGYSMDEYNKEIELAEAEPSRKHSEVINDINEWLSNKKKKALV